MVPHVDVASVLVDSATQRLDQAGYFVSGRVHAEIGFVVEVSRAITRTGVRNLRQQDVRWTLNSVWRYIIYDWLTVQGPVKNF